MASFKRAISCRLVKQVSSLRSWEVSFLSSTNKSIGGTRTRTSTALVDTVRYAETILRTTPLLCREQLFLDSVVVKGTCADRSCIKQLRIYHARHEPSLSFPGATNVGHEPSQSGSTLDRFGSRDLQVCAEAKPSTQLHTQVLNALFPLDFMFPENDPRVFEGSPVYDQQRLGLFRGHPQASAIQPTLCPPQTIIDLQLQDFNVVSGAHDKCVIREADDDRSSRQVHAQKIVVHDVPKKWTHPWPLNGATCHLSFGRPLVALVYHPPVAQIVIYHSQQVVWNLFPHHRLDADVPPRGIERIAYVNADQRAESLTLTSSSSSLSGEVHHFLDGVNCGPAFPKAKKPFSPTMWPCSLCRIISSRSFPIVSNRQIGL